MFSKGRYLDLMDRAVGAYSSERIDAYIADVRENTIGEHGFCRLTSNLGFLIAHGRRTEEKSRFREMMDICCSQIPFAHGKNGDKVGNDFSVKEIVICLLELEKAGTFPREVTDAWREGLAKIDPYEVYTRIAPVPAERVNNWAAFAAASEQLRVFAGIGGDRRFIDDQIASQVLSFDENGMYRDPHEPMVYDMVTRLQLAVCLFFGYDGAFRGELASMLNKSALPTLRMQSTSGEIPFGGRSNQFLHNESFLAALLEYYARAYTGPAASPSLFRGGAKLASDSLERWLSREKISHVKNGYDPDLGLGCEGYGYFDKYMVTLGSWCMLAYVFADDSVGADRDTLLRGTSVFSASRHFHKQFLKAGCYYAETELSPDANYDAAGIGKIQKAGASPVICISCPCPVNPKYRLPEPNEKPLSVAPGVILHDGTFRFALDRGSEYVLKSLNQTDNEAFAAYDVLMPDAPALSFSVSVTPEGVVLRVGAEDKTDCALLLPVIETDGRNASSVTLSEDSLTVSFDGSTCTYTAEQGKISDAGYSAFNRNGRLRAFAISGGPEISVKIEIK